jgi:TonB family protein
MSKATLVGVLLIASGMAFGQGAVETLDRIAPDSREDTDRTPVHTVIPEYPQQAWFERVQGDVEVCFFITRGGRPYNIAVRKSDHRIFERPARDAVKNSWFEAIPRPDKVPQVKTCRTFLFRLEPVENDDDVTESLGDAT